MYDLEGFPFIYEWLPRPPFFSFCFQKHNLLPSNLFSSHFEGLICALPTKLQK